ncbi:MAG: FUSC family protein [Alphaproteobacteria bacterium]|nr:FUSC family protein [Alphaproteobacteria bacterium]
MFLIDIGVPFIAATAAGLHRAALLGAVTGLLCSFADENNAPLPRRLRTLGFAAGGVAVGGLCGHWLIDYPPAFWVLFVTAVFAAGWLNAFGKGPHMGVRFGAIALGIISGTSGITPDLVLVPLAAAALTLLVRIVDHVLNGPMPPPEGFRPPGKPSRHRDWARFSLAYAAAAVIGLWIGVRYGATRAIWVTVAPLVVMQPEAQASYRRVIEFVIGTAIGVAVAFALTWIVQSTAVLCLIVLLLAALIPGQFPQRFWLQTAMIATMVLTAYRFAVNDINVVRPLIVERLEDIAIGCVLAVLGTIIAFAEQPRAATVEVAIKPTEAGPAVPSESSARQ